MATPSHRLKLQRAHEHLKELDRLVRFGARQPYPVIETIQTKSHGRRFTYTLDLSETGLPERFPIVLGDLLFNVRSALDHLVVAIAPTNRKRKASFPIFTADPLRLDEEGRDYADSEAAGAWGARTKGLPDNCIAVLKAAQPYEMARHEGKPAADHALAILGALQNADKHRELVTVRTGLADARVSLDDGKTWTYGVPGTVLKDRAKLATVSHEMKVQVEGAPVVAVGRRDELRDLRDFLSALNETVYQRLLPALEPFLG